VLQRACDVNHRTHQPLTCHAIRAQTNGVSRQSLLIWQTSVVISRADGSPTGMGVRRRLRVCLSVGLFVCLFVCFSVRYLKKVDAPRITKLDMEMFHRECWKPVYFGTKRSKSLFDCCYHVPLQTVRSKFKVGPQKRAVFAPVHWG